MKIVKRMWLLLLPLIGWAGSISITNNQTGAVNDNTCFDRTFDVPLSSTITNVIMEVNIDHTYRADLNVSLMSPSGTVVDLTSGNGGWRNNLYTIFDDTATQSIVNDNQNQNSVVTRSPEQALSTFNGENSSGIWTLTICDTANGDTGTYNYGTLTIYNADPTSPPIVTPVPNQVATVNQTFSVDLSVYVAETDGDPIQSYQLGGTLPAGMTFDTTTGILSGTPTTLGSTGLTLSATDKDGTSAGEDFAFKVVPDSPRVEYRMDECFWFNSSAVTGDVRDSSPFGSNATSSGSVSVTANGANPPICNYGTFAAQPDLVSTEDTTVGNTSGGFSVSFWMRASQDFGSYAVIATKSKAYDWNDGWGFVNPNSATGTTLRFYINAYSGTNIETTVAPADGWVHIVGTYDQNNLRLYKNGVEVAGSPVATSETITNSSDPIRLGYDNANDAEFVGDMDEFKFWERPLTATEVQDLYNNELSGLNYDGTARTCNTCSASLTANVWEMVGIPADLRTGTFTVSDVFSDDITGTYGTDWRVYRMDYSDTNNSSWYTYLAETDPLEFGKGYWVMSKQNATWNVNDIEAVTYDSSSPDCPAARCVEIDIRSVALQDGVDDLLGTGPYRYNLTGSVGKKPVNWADCRLLVDGVAYTPSGAEAAGYMNKQIWQYNPSSSSADSKGYITCDDTTPGGCQLIPYKGFWMELHGPTKGKVVKLLVPEE